MTLTKADIVKDTRDNCNLSRAQAFNIAETIFEIIKATLESGEDVLRVRAKIN